VQEHLTGAAVQTDVVVPTSPRSSEGTGSEVVATHYRIMHGG
jgi:hypothetical protein